MIRDDLRVGQPVIVTRPCVVSHHRRGTRHELRAGQSGGITALKARSARIHAGLALDRRRADLLLAERFGVGRRHVQHLRARTSWKDLE